MNCMYCEIKMEVLKEQISNIANEIKKLGSGNTDENVKNYIKQLKKQKTELTKQLNEQKKNNASKRPGEFQVKQAIAFGDTVARKGKGMKEAYEIQQQRDKERSEYIKNKENLENYLENDSKDVPGLLLLHHNIIKEYGKCSYINKSDNTSIAEIEVLRKDWLGLQYDNGATYYSLYDCIYNKKPLIELQEKLDKLDTEINDVYSKYVVPFFDNIQKKLYVDFIKYSKKYFESKTKSKNIKERLKNAISNNSIIVKFSKINLTDYYNIKYGYNMIVDTDYDISSITTPNEICMNIELQTKIHKLVNEYANTHKEIHTMKKYIDNTLHTLKNDLSDFLAGKTIDVLNSALPRQQGKYFKRWTMLSQVEKRERLEHYCEYFVERFIVFEGLAEYDTGVKLKESLKNIILDAFDDKKLSCRNFTWNSKTGIIESIKSLKYNQESKEWSIEISKPVVQKKHKSSIKTIITKDNEKIINELLLRNIVMDTSITIDTCLELIKERLALHRISNADKEIINNKYIEIMSVVLDN